MWQLLPRFPRYAMRFPVFFRRLERDDQGQTGVGLTENVGEEGASVLLDTSLPQGCRLGLVLFVRNELVEVEARVTGVQPQGGRDVLHHLEFTPLTPAQQITLLKLLPQEKSFRRRSLRLPMTLPVTCRVHGDDSASLKGETRNLSRTGAEILLPQPLSPEAMIEVTLGEAPETRMPGRVRWMGEGSEETGWIRHGVEFFWPPLSAEVFTHFLLSTLPKEDQERLLEDLGQ
ncbi:MAG: PilZ domain-containing protein [Candidatus Methylomirabilia bacterium]